MDLGDLLGPLGWTVQVAAAFAIAFFARTVFSPEGKTFAGVARASAVIALLAVLGAAWVVHPAAGMLLGFFGSRAFGNWRPAQPGLVAGLLAAVVFMALGAGWLIYPLFFMGLAWAVSGGFGQRERAPQAEAARPPELPSQVPGVSLFKSAPDDRLNGYVQDARLPADARAQLAALNIRTREALDLLRGQGQQGSEAEYLTRAVREEYAPNAVEAYLKLPRTLADTAPLQDGKTGRALLVEQLELLLDGVQDVLNTALQSGGQELLTHGRFLRDRFARTTVNLADDLRVPAEVKVR
ncbi:hypothetical protein GCM10008959_03360 [Deinococcus seoulensis]|uniref:Uncharacterized protein n=1 Tax=Deinococcus seoulensis TaxID=1837379 RepID=A0ABQ2RPV8_9DEIO|nr:hypothetical protein [Deinococcus seoulensis]GGR45529.1 hypothetical protein GCM10008959_03360 [Deinococcus seoulensis]